MKKHRLVITVDSHGGEYLFAVIEAVVLLNHRQPRHTTVLFLPTQPPFIALAHRLRGLVRKRATTPAAQADTSATPSVYHQVQRGETVIVERASYNIRLKRASIPWPRALMRSGSSLIGALRIWRGCVRHSRVQPAPLLGARYHGVHIGDLVASTFFRNSRSSDALKPEPRLFATLWWACYMVEITADLVKAQPTELTFAHTPEPTYVHSVPYRYVRQMGGGPLATNHPHDPLLAPAPALTVNGTTAANHDAEPGIREYFHNRLYAAGKILWYMSDGQNDNHAESIVDLAGAGIELERDRLYVVLFLHSLADGQYYFGTDGFESLADWTYHSIEKTLANHAVHRLLIKPHPIVDYKALPGDKLAFERIVRYCSRSDRIRVLSATTSLVALCKQARLVGLTHHGSVAEELVYLGQPVIASTYARWSDRYRFAQLWSNPQQYDALIAKLSPESWAPPSAAEREALFRYVRDYRLREIPQDRVNPTFILARVTAGNGSAHLGMPHEERERHARRLEALTTDDPTFARVLEEFDQLAVSGPQL